MEDDLLQNKKLTKHIRQNIREVRKLLIYSDGSQGSAISAMRDESYFIFRAILGINNQNATINDHLEGLLKKLTGWRSQIQEFLKVQKGVTKKSWIEGLESREREFFFQEIWLK